MKLVADIRQLPELGDDSIHIWGVHLPAVLDRLDDLEAVLCVSEREKVARFQRDADRQLSMVTRGALRVLLGGYMGIPAPDLRFDYSGTGKPYVARSEFTFNVSHSVDWAVLAIGRNRQVGVDLEQIQRHRNVEAIASRYFTAEEVVLIERAADPYVMFFHLWARKEAYVKACGSALFRKLSSFAVPVEDTEKEGWHFRRLEAGSHYAAAVVTDRVPAEIPCYDFGGLKWVS